MIKPSPFAPSEPASMYSVQGLKLATAACGLKASGNTDLLLVSLPETTRVAGVFTQSSTSAAPVDWCRDILHTSPFARALVVHSGNANAFTGRQGEQFVADLAQQIAQIQSCPAEHVYVCATGVIGQQVDSDKVFSHLSKLNEQLSQGQSHWQSAAEAIMTTDTFAKMASEQLLIEQQEVTITGVSKGSGMIMPNMATMLGFVFTDLAIPQNVLQNLLSRYSNETFNCITVDSDTSTNDTVLLFATGEVKLSGAPIESDNDVRLEGFKAKLKSILTTLAKNIVMDGEGISKLMEVQVSGALSEESAKSIAMTVANSPLVKTAIAGGDPNWGRLVMAVGKSNEPCDKYRLSIAIGGVALADDGTPVVLDAKSESELHEYMQGRNITLHIDVGVGDAQSTVWSSDLTHGYITINADYTT